MLQKWSILCALFLAAAFSRPIFADEFAVNFGPGNNPAAFVFDYDPATHSFTSTPAINWVAGSGELFEFTDLDVSIPVSAPACATGPTGDAQIFNCLIATTLTDPSITHTWMVSPGAGYSQANQVADFLLTINDGSGALLLDSGPVLGTGQCAPGRTPPCGYGGSTFSGGFAVTSVPEPASLGLTLLGLGLGAGITRRRVRRPLRA